VVRDSNNRIILRDKFHNIVEVGHVFADQEGCVTSFDLLVVGNGLDLVSGPLTVLDITQIVFSSYEHSYWNLVNIAQINLGGCVLVVVLLIFRLAPVIICHSFLTYSLTVVNETLHARRGGEMRHVDLESVVIIKSRVLSDGEALDCLADAVEILADLSRGHLRTLTKHIVDMNNGSEITKGIC